MFRNDGRDHGDILTIVDVTVEGNVVDPKVDVRTDMLTDGAPYAVMVKAVDQNHNTLTVRVRRASLSFAYAPRLRARVSLRHLPSLVGTRTARRRCGRRGAVGRSYVRGAPRSRFHRPRLRARVSLLHLPSPVGTRMARRKPMELAMKWIRVHRDAQMAGLARASSASNVPAKLTRTPRTYTKVGTSDMIGTFARINLSRSAFTAIRGAALKNRSIKRFDVSPPPLHASRRQSLRSDS